MKIRKGFACLTPERMFEVARQGGLAAIAKHGIHRFTKEEYQANGRKGGLKVSADRKHMAKIAKIGAEKRKKKEELKKAEAPIVMTSRDSVL